MPANYALYLVGRQRSVRANRQLGWTLAFGALGIVLNAVMFLVIEAITPGDLRRIVTSPGPARPLAYVAAASALSVGLIVCASIA